jgi:hypothetical protein
VEKKGLGCIEIVLPRTEVPRDPKPGENRHRAFDIVVDPSITLEEDAKRRDFTFNALYKPLPNRPDDLLDIIDPTGRGLYDLQHRIVSTTHATSFRDDPLRTLRALRFVSVLGYDLSKLTREQMEEYAPFVTGLSAKGYASGTVLDELSKILMGEDVGKALRLARDTGVLATLLPELEAMLGFEQDSRYHDMTTDEHTFTALETAASVDAPLRVRMALLFHDAGKPEAAWIGPDGRKHYYATVLTQTTGLLAGTPLQTEDHEVVSERLWLEAAERLGADRKLKFEVASLVRNHMVTVVGKVKPVKVRRERVRLGDDMLRDLYLHRMCDVSGKGKPNMEYLTQLGQLERVRQEAQRDGVPASTKDLQINGHDCAALGIYGRDIGEVLETILDEVVCQPNEQLLSREWQLERAARFAADRAKLTTR